MDASQLQRLKARLKSPCNIVLIPHRSPDGDAIGSCLGLYHYLRNIGQAPHVISPTDYPKYLKWLPGSKDVWIYEKQEADAKRIVQGADLIFYLDFNTLHRTDKMRQVLLESTAAVVLIDHHPQPDSFTYMYSDPQMSSTCEMVYHFISKLGGQEQLDAQVATCLYTGLMTDTASFRLPNTSATTYRVAADLVARGADNAQIYQLTFDSYTPQRINLLGVALKNLHILPEYSTAYIALSSEELLKNNYQRGDTEGFVNYGLAIKGIKIAVLFIEDQERGIIKISFRCRAGFRVDTLAREHFHGGGHLQAAGGISHKSLSATLSHFKSLLKTYWEAQHQMPSPK